MPKIMQSVETSVFDKDGEFISKRANRVLSWGNEPSYIKLYLKDVLYFSDLPKGHERILFELLKRVSYAGDRNGMQIVLNIGVKRQIMAALELTNVRTINNALSDLVKGKILFRIDTGIYKLNPYFFGKGDWQDISRLRLEVNYSEIEGRTFQAVVENRSRMSKTEEEITQ